MTRLAISVTGALLGDGIFDPMCSANRDDCLLGYRLLRSAVMKRGGEVHTADVWLNQGRRPDAVLFLDIPRDQADMRIFDEGVERWALLQECEVVMPWNWDRSRQAPFQKIFTWCDLLVDGKRFFKANFHTPFVRGGGGPDSRANKVVVIAGNKRADHDARELYSSRRVVLERLDLLQPGCVDLFGQGWERRVFPWRRPWSRCNSVTMLTNTLVRPPRAYRGPLVSKGPTLSGYKFALCFENARGMTGYVTEKIFDAMLAGAVPIYWGAENIKDLIPESCFIDYRELRSPEALHDLLLSTDDGAVRRYQAAIDAFLITPEARAWSSEGFTDVLAAHL